MLKTISWTLSLSIVLMSPGFNCWAALSETVSGPNAGVDLVPANMNARMQNIGDNSAANFLNVESFEIPAKELGTVPNSISVTPTKVGVQSHKIFLDSGLRIAGVTTKADRKPQSGFKATLTKHAAKITQAAKNIRQAVKNHIAGKIANWRRIFDGASFHPALALAGAAGYLPQAASSLRKANLYLATINDVSSKAEVPAPGQKADVPGPLTPSFPVQRTLTQEEMAKFKQLIDFAITQEQSTILIQSYPSERDAWGQGLTPMYDDQQGGRFLGTAIYVIHKFMDDDKSVKTETVDAFLIKPDGTVGDSQVIDDKKTASLENPEVQRRLNKDISFWMNYEIPGAKKNWIAKIKHALGWDQSAAKGKIIAVIAGLAMGALALALMPHLALAATHAAMGVGGTFAGNAAKGVLLGAVGGAVIGVMAAVLLANRIFPKSGDAKVMLVVVAPVLGGIGAVIGAFLGFIVKSIF